MLSTKDRHQEPEHSYGHSFILQDLTQKAARTEEISLSILHPFPFFTPKSPGESCLSHYWQY